MALVYEGINLVFDPHGYDENGDPDQGITVIDLDIEGAWLHQEWGQDLPISIAITLDTPGISTGQVWGSGLSISIAVEIPFNFLDVSFEAHRDGFVKWSKIGDFDFTIEEDGMAGEMQMDWAGLVYQTRKLGSRVITYGANGVSILSPSGKFFGLNTIHRIGLLGRDAFAGTDFIHYFIDKRGCLYQLDETLQKLDYREFLSLMTTPVLTLDEKNNLLYICDGTYGYIYSPDSQSFGSGPVNVTGMGYQSGTQYIVSPAAITTPDFEMWTDIYDLGNKKGKSLQSLEVGIDLTRTVYAAIKTRSDGNISFRKTDWYVIDPRGIAFIPCYGHEFQFGFKTEGHTYLEIDYINVIGEVNAY